MFHRHGPLALAPVTPVDNGSDDLSILLVNEPPDILDEVAGLLRERGLTVHVAASVREARRLLATRGIGVLVADVSLLQQGEGLALAAQVLGGQQPMAAVELLLIAAHPGQEGETAAPLLDKLGLLQAPLRLPDIMQAITRSLGRATMRRTATPPRSRGGYDA